MKANEWVDRVYGWVAGRNSADVCRALHLAQGGDVPVSLIVLTRHVADFVGTTNFDRRAIWTSWPRLAKTVSENSDENFVAALVRRLARPTTKHRGTVVNEYHFPGLSVELRVS
ncbi:MAG: hypothetical protein ABS76_05850 [Pelagibacterium sp. SCN 64-44]|nr:MAG: hypothetical protein ABS76_05850 [Pelagibacterium sp. SCN 64-44]